MSVTTFTINKTAGDEAIFDLAPYSDQGIRDDIMEIISLKEARLASGSRKAVVTFEAELPLDLGPYIDQIASDNGFDPEDIEVIAISRYNFDEIAIEWEAVAPETTLTFDSFELATLRSVRSLAATAVKDGEASIVLQKGSAARLASALAPYLE